MPITLGVGALQRVHLEAALGIELVAVVGSIVAATPDHERRVAKVHQRDIAGMPCHHRSCCPRVGHAWGHAPDTVATGRIAHDVDLVWIHVEPCHAHLDELFVEAVERLLAPHVPVVVGRTRSHVNTLRRTVEALLVAPLLVVHQRMGVAAAVQRYPQAASVAGFLAIDGFPDGHFQAVHLNDVAFPGALQALLGGSFPRCGELLAAGLCLSLTERLGRCGKHRQQQGNEKNVQTFHHVLSSLQFAKLRISERKTKCFLWF